MSTENGSPSVTVCESTEIVADPRDEPELRSRFSPAHSGAFSAASEPAHRASHTAAMIRRMTNSLL